MDILHHRPLFSWCAAFMTASLLGAFFPPVGKGIFGGVFLLCSLVYALWQARRREGYRAFAAVMAALLACLGLLRSYQTFQSREVQAIRSLEHTTVQMTGIVTDRRGGGGYMTVYTFSAETINGEATDGLFLLTCHYISDLRPGNRVALEAEILPLTEAAGDTYDALSLVGDGFVAGLLSEEEGGVTVVEEETRLWSVRVGNLRRLLAARLELLTGDRGGGLPSSLFLGDKTYLADEVRRDFARAGVAHLLAISGLHMTLLFGALASLLQLLRIPKGGRSVLLAAGLLAYLFLLGFPPSATRAAVMLGMTYFAYLSSAQSDSLTSLGLAGALILAVTPYAVSDAGFWMSFLATLGLVTVMPLLQSRLDRLSAKPAPLWWSLLRADLLRAGTVLLVGMVAVSFTLLVVVAVIGEFGVLSPLSTLLLTPLCGIILVLSLICLPLMGTTAGPLLGVILGEISHALVDLTAWMAAPSWVVVSLRHPSVAPAVLALAAVMLAATLVLLVVRLPDRRRGLVLLPLLAGWVAVGGVLAVHRITTEGEVSATYLQPSSVSEALVLVSGQQGFVCDLSNGSLSAMTAAATEAKERGATELAVFMLTHYHTRTPGALETLLRRETVRALWVPFPKDVAEYEVLLSCMERAAGADVPIYMYREGEAERIFGEGTVCLERSWISRSRQSVLLVSIDLPQKDGNGCRVVYGGSAVFESDLNLVAREWMQSADTVIFGSHGPLLKRPFGTEISLQEDCTVILSAHGNTAAYLDPVCLSEGHLLWKGQKRWILRNAAESPS